MIGNLFTGTDAREGIMRGVDAVSDAVKGTLGSAGYNALLEAQEYPFSLTTNDGVSIARAIQLSDPLERIGANLMKEIASRSDKQSNDGTTTAITLAQAILHEGMKSDASPMEIKRSLEECLPLIEKAIDDQTKQITLDEVGKVAAISAEDEQIGALIQEIYQQIGKDGILFRDISQTFTDHYTIGKGIHMEDAGYSSPYMVDLEPETGKPLVGIKLKNPKVLVTTKLSSLEEVGVLAANLKAKGITDLVIFCEEFEAIVLAQAAGTRIKNNFRIIVVKLPVLWRNQWLEDVSLMTGATILDGVNKTLKQATETDLGSCETIEMDKTNTYFGGIKDIQGHIDGLNQEGSDESRIRAARLNTKSARLYVGAASDQALAYRRLKVEDAVGAAFQALHGGIVAGGGVALINTCIKLPDTIGGRILRQALVAPYEQILKNAGIEDDLASNSESESWGFNAKTGEVVDMFEAGIVDPATVVKTSVRNALSVAASVLTTSVVVTLPPQEEHGRIPNIPMR